MGKKTTWVNGPTKEMHDIDRLVSQMWDQIDVYLAHMLLRKQPLILAAYNYHRTYPIEISDTTRESMLSPMLAANYLTIVDFMQWKTREGIYALEN